MNIVITSKRSQQLIISDSYLELGIEYKIQIHYYITENNFIVTKKIYSINNK